MQKIMSAQLIDFQYSLAPSDSPTIAVLESIKPEGDQEELHKREQVCPVPLSLFLTVSQVRQVTLANTSDRD